ncbi:chemotaxis protein CheX [Cellulomonas taurus]|jgi:chemotaxis protein CheX|uniref:chemotaxis protein CheX n=1 Tax=Cellulomonas taurus TaxID=2729175 RepID=UPI00145C4842|nr:chemotaxis protein CheX [Cellulomonas taurus]
MSIAVETDQVYAITEEVFGAMIDPEPGYLRPWEGDLPTPTDPLAAWVDVHGELAGRAAVICETATAHELARALLRMEPHEEVTPADLVDAFGEVANVVGGNIKALLPSQGSLTLPQVAAAVPQAPADAPAHTLALDWRGHPLSVVVWLF